MFPESLDVSLGLLFYDSIVDFEHVFEMKIKFHFSGRNDVIEACKMLHAHFSGEKPLNKANVVSSSFYFVKHNLKAATRGQI